jgi:hypothetical protein
MTQGDPTTLLATELELVAPFDLQPLLAHFAASVSVLRNSVEDAVRTLWLGLEVESHDLDAAIEHWIALVDSLPPDLRARWDACSDRCLNTGIQGGTTPHAACFAVSEHAVSGLSRISVRLVFSVYALASGDRVAP